MHLPERQIGQGLQVKNLSNTVATGTTLVTSSAYQIISNLMALLVSWAAAASDITINVYGEQDGNAAGGTLLYTKVLTAPGANGQYWLDINQVDGYKYLYVTVDRSAGAVVINNILMLGHGLRQQMPILETDACNRDYVVLPGVTIMGAAIV